MKYIYELMLENYAKCTCLLQSHRSGKFVSDQLMMIYIHMQMPLIRFNPLDRGNLYQI